MDSPPLSQRKAETASKSKRKTWTLALAGTSGPLAVLLAFSPAAYSQTQNLCERLDALNDAGTVCDLSGKGIKSLKVGDFNGLSKVRILHLEDNALTTLPDNVFSGLSSLEQLYLGPFFPWRTDQSPNIPTGKGGTSYWTSGNPLTSISADAFSGLSKLKHLSMSNNSLISLPEDVFDGLSNLVGLSLYNNGYRNSLTSLPENIFDGLSNLEHLSLHGSQLSSLPEDVFDGLSNLKELGLGVNHLKSLPEDVFDGLSNLKNLYLQDNKLTNLPKDIFDGLSNLTSIMLNNNKLTCLPKDIFDGLSNLRYAFVGDLPHCEQPTLSLPKDTPPVVSFSGSESVSEDAGTHGVTVKLTPTPTSNINLNYTMGGTATAGTDYTALSGSVTVAAGKSSVDIPVVITDDEIQESSETIILTLMNGADYDLGATTTYTLTIKDDDRAGVTIRESEGTTTVTEAAGAGRTDSYTVALASKPSADVSIRVASATPTAAQVHGPGGAAGGAATLRFTPGNWSTVQTVTVTGVDDNVENENEEQNDSGIVALSHRSVRISHTAVSDDDNYDGIDIADVVVQVVDDDATTLYDKKAAVPQQLTVSLSAEQETIDEANGKTRFTITLSRVLAAGETATVPYTVTGGTVGDHWNIRFPKKANGVGVEHIPPGNGKKGAVKFSEGGQKATLTLIGRPDSDKADRPIAIAFGTGKRTPSTNVAGGITPLGDPLTVTIVDSVYPQTQNLCERLDALNDAGTVCDLSGRGIKSLKVGDFNGLSKVRILHLEDNALTTLPDNVFSGLSSLEQLYLGPYSNGTFIPTGKGGSSYWASRNPLTSISADAFSGLSKLKHLSMSNNSLISLPEDVFDGLSNLVGLSLYNNGYRNSLTSLPENIFDGLSNLEYLSLHGSQLSSLPEDVFDGLSNLKELGLGVNQLKSLPEDVFDGLSNLKDLYLQDNKLTSLPKDIFDGLSNLTSIMLNNNKLTCLPEDIFDGLSNLRYKFVGDLPHCEQPTLVSQQLTASLSAEQETIDEANGKTRLTIALSRPLAAGETATVPYTVTGGTVGDHWNIRFPKKANGAGVEHIPGNGKKGAVKFSEGGQKATLTLIGRPDSDKADRPIAIAFGTGKRAPSTNVAGGITPLGDPLTVTIVDSVELLVSLSAEQTTISDGRGANRRTRFTIALSRPLAAGETATVPYTVTGGAVGDHWNIRFPKKVNGAGVEHIPPGNGKKGAVKFSEGGQKATLTLIGRPDSDKADRPVAIAFGTGKRAPSSNVAGGIMPVGDPLTVTIVDGDDAALWVADATVNEDAGLLRFSVHLSAPVQEVVLVSYRTRESTPVSAQEGRDYERASGQLIFQPGQSSKQVPITIINDLHDEGRETFELVLSNPRKVRIADGVGVGAIINNDPLPGAWLVRFGRTVAQQVVDALQARFTVSPQEGLTVMVAGEDLTSEPMLVENEGVLSKVLGFESVTVQQMVEGSAFSFSPPTDA
ncbi:Calx-beta domain-containing protein, partial [Candidatus Synechococcus spongiarum]|uniref:Calx-beta domain-containing protein n=1 Tax=Candidatus Synechococcus spongiarum TaxID=431041 RepID=UPI001268E9A9